MTNIIPKNINTSKSALGWELVLDGWYPGNMSRYKAYCFCISSGVELAFVLIVSIFN